MNDFYVGYLPHAPSGLKPYLRVSISGLIGLAAAVAILLVVAQQPFANSFFAYGHYHEYEGLILEEPHPTLLTPQGRYLLVAPGKHGIDRLVQGMNFRSVRLRASLIERAPDRMLEVVTDSIQVTGSSFTPVKSTSLGTVTLTGEIVDTKCYLGVMNPGSGKVHRGCAARCISGGIPPALLVRDNANASRVVLLKGAHRQSIHRHLLDFVAEPIQITGQLSHADGVFTLEFDPTTIRRRE